MPENGSHSTARLCDTFAVGLMALALAQAHAGKAMASEERVMVVGPQTPDISRLRQPSLPPAPLALSLPPSYEMVPQGDIEATPSTRDFRPRGPSMTADTAASGSADSGPMMRTTVWERLADFRAHNRIRLLTLWESGGGSLSLQAGHKGSPSLQWTSRLMNRGGATHGVFDKLLSASLAGASRSLRVNPRAAASEPAARPTKPIDSTAAK